MATNLIAVAVVAVVLMGLTMTVVWWARRRGDRRRRARADETRAELRHEDEVLRCGHSADDGRGFP